MISDAQARATKKYQDKNYDFYKVRFNKGDRERVKKMAEKEGKSLNQFILDRIFSCSDNLPEDN